MYLNRIPLESSDVTAQTLRMHHDPQRDTPDAIEIVPATRAAQPDLIDAYWDDVEERVHYLMSLLGAGRNNEALALCAVYLEGVAHALVCSNAPEAEPFADEAEEHASDPYLSLVHPAQLVCVAAQLHGLSPSAVHGLHATFPGPEHTLLRKGQAVSIVRANLAQPDAVVVERALWKCTVAYLIYDFITTQSFRRREGAHTIGLGTAFREGNPVQGLSVPELVALLCSMIAEARSRSHASGTLPA